MRARAELVASLRLAALLVAGACGPLPAPVPASGPGQDPGGASAAAFLGVEEEALRALAASDRRLASRGGIEPRDEDLRRVTMAALLAEDATLAVIDGGVDLFSFEARARELAGVRARVDVAALGLSVSASGAISAAALERELLRRLVDAELVRLEEERGLPRSASALVRGVVEAWRAPATAEQAAERDRWLARRLGEVLGAVRARDREKGMSAPLDVGRARELDDALDALEHAIDAAGLSRSTAQLVLLREALEGQGTRPAAGAASDWSQVERGARAHLGLTLTAEEMDARLTMMATALGRGAALAMAGAQVAADVVEGRAAALVFASTPCVSTVPGSRVRSMTPPPERAAACRLRLLVGAATDPTSRAVALVVLHDQVTVARWALDVARGTATIAQTMAKHRPRSRPGPEIMARWERVALAQATVAIGSGFAAGLLYGTGDPEVRARAWTELGDVPMDIAERALRGQGVAVVAAFSLERETRASFSSTSMSAMR